jgi:hypothetical protein
MATGTVLRELYEGESRRAVRFRYGLLLFDLSTIIYLAVTSFVGGSQRLFRDGLPWTVDMIDDAADAFTACNDRLVDLLNDFLAASISRTPKSPMSRC